MRNVRPLSVFFLQVCIFCCFPNLLHAYSIRQFSNEDGLSNSAIPSLYQDQQGIIWIGSCDGLNTFDGTKIQQYHPYSSKSLLSGNLIHHIIGAEKDVIWIKTNYGLDRLDTKRQTCLNFTEFKDNFHIAKNDDNELFILKDDGYLYHYQRELQTFQKLDTPPIAFEHVLSIMVDTNNILWVFNSGINTLSYSIKKEGQKMTVTPSNLFTHPEKLLWAFSDEHLAYFIDETYALYEYDFSNRKEYYIADLKSEIEAHGDVSSIIKQQNDYYIGFKSSGLIILKYMADQKIKYQIQPTEIHSGIFYLMKDKFQDIVWIGTDGQGLYMYYNDTFSITNTLLNTPIYQVNNPVRTLYYDEEQTLWIGTKGGGILRIKNYSPEANTPTSFDRITVGNSPLSNNAVYCFAPSRTNKLWIGTENGINYYSYKERKLKEFPIIADGKKVKYVHSINELNDTTLWVTTVGEGIVKVILKAGNTSPVVKSADRIVLDNGRMAMNYFFTSFQENDSILWFGNRGYGAYRLNVKTGELTPHKFDDIVNSQMANDIFAIHKNDKGYWLGTSSGLIYYTSNSSQYKDRAKLLTNNTIHGILEDSQGNLWISTNQGLVRFNQQTNAAQTYSKGNGLSTTEFSDGAFYKDARTETLFFGGTNGFVTIKSNNYLIEDYTPQIHFKGLSIFGKEYNIHDFLEVKGDQSVLQLDYGQNFFGINFMALDYINGNNYSYFYKLDNISDHWIESGTVSGATFSNLSPGQYTLLVKYKNNINGKESQPEELIIRITPPWYLSNWAYTTYFILFVLFCTLMVYNLIRKYRRRQHRMIDKMNRKKKEEIYESKLRFFTNITHEFCTPLTLIYGPCEKILAYANNDQYIQKYGQIILQNAKKLNELILELIEFRRLETGNKQLRIIRLSASENIQNMAASFNELAESRNISYQLKITQNIDWNSDLSCLNKIVSNLLSNAFKYTPDNGSVTIELTVEQNRLSVSVSNSGKGIAKENLDKIFDRYKILDNFETSSIYSRSGLGLAICHSMTTLLSGQIEVTSIPNEITTFTVTLPELALSEEQTDYQTNDPIQNPLAEASSATEHVALPFDPDKQTVMIIDDDTSMLWFVSELFADTYNVLSFDNAEDALKQLKTRQPDLIISDVMMPDIDGILFTQKVKKNKVWCHIPLILLSARHQTEEQIKGIEAGAEAYVTKPFDINYLKKIAQRLIQRKEDLKTYYSSIASSFQLDDGHFLHNEDKQFFDQMMEIISNNIDNSNLSVETLSNELKLSVRQFYRRLKQITDKTPADIIREYRLETARQLLLSTHLTIDEIMDKTGFNNRSTFYKLFSQKFGVPPRQYREEKKSEFKDEMQEKGKSLESDKSQESDEGQ